jgi:hypothetical protein
MPSVTGAVWLIGTVMPRGDYPVSIEGFRFLQQRELPPVSTCWDFQTTETFQSRSARRLLAELPEDCQLSFLDPEGGKEEAWLFVRRSAQHYFIQEVRRGSSSWTEQPLEAVLASFLASPLVAKPIGSFDSFTVSSIPEHQRHEHTSRKA